MLEAGAEHLAGGHLRSTGDPHTAHSVTEAIDPEAGHVILLDLHGVALEVGSFKQADLVLLGVLGKKRPSQAWEVRTGQREATELGLLDVKSLLRPPRDSPGIAAVQPGRAALTCESSCQPLLHRVVTRVKRVDTHRALSTMPSTPSKFLFITFMATVRTQRLGDVSS